MTASFNTDQDINGNIGVHYRISSQKLAAVTYVANFKKWSNLHDSMLIFTYVHKGLVLKFPILTTNQGDNPSSVTITALLFLGANMIAYYALK